MKAPFIYFESYFYDFFETNYKSLRSKKQEEVEKLLRPRPLSKAKSLLSNIILDWKQTETFLGLSRVTLNFSVTIIFKVRF